MPAIDQGGVAIHYEVHGPASGTAPAMLLSHGYGATSRMWDGQIAAFADGYRIICGTCAATANRATRPTPPSTRRR